MSDERRKIRESDLPGNPQTPYRPPPPPPRERPQPRRRHRKRTNERSQHNRAQHIITGLLVRPGPASKAGRRSRAY